MASVFRMRNAAANSVIAASRAMVERMSAVEDRIDAAMSRGADSMYGSTTRASPMAPVTASASAPAASTTSTRVIPERGDAARGRRAVDVVQARGGADRQHDRPSGRAEGRAVPREHPRHAQAERRPGTVHHELAADVQRLGRRQVLRDQRGVLVQRLQRHPPGQGQVADARLAGRIDAQHRDGLPRGGTARRGADEACGARCRGP